jgi:hypothetical protein
MNVNVNCPVQAQDKLVLLDIRVEWRGGDKWGVGTNETIRAVNIVGELEIACDEDDIWYIFIL